MTVRTEYPRAIREIEHIWITMSDGCRLSARMWLPVDAEDHPVPAILEYIPYRKDDATAPRDALQHPYIAGHGYACVRVDLRGSGDSDGILADEYLPQEQDDALEVIAWLAEQPWCNGAVGMIGISWGGFNGLQVAARRPPALKAVISLCSTDDRYHDDVHYSGGCLLGVDQLPWAATMLALNARPPLPSIVGDGWRATWLDRLERTPPYIHAWMEHQRRDAYWKHGSVCEDYAAIACAVYLVGGWADAYTNSIPRLMAGLRCPRKGLIGPWGHGYPEVASPGPRIGFLQECLRWWDYWLKGRETGIMDEPPLRAWIVDAYRPAASHDHWPGRWVAEPSWPSPNVTQRTLYLTDNRLDDVPGSERERTIRGMQVAGRDAGVWCPYGMPGDFPTDQRLEDGLALCFDSEPLAADLTLLGYPEAHLTLAVDQPLALVAVRLCDVHPDGASTLISRGLLNLTHRESHEHPTPLVPGTRYRVTVHLDALGYRLPAGHRLRLAVSPTYWPHAWPSPVPVTLRLFTGAASVLQLPARAPSPDDDTLRPFDPPEHAAPLETIVHRTPSRTVTITDDPLTGQHVERRVADGGSRTIVANGVTLESVGSNVFSIVEGDPLSAQVRCEHTIRIRQGEIDTRVETVSVMSANATHFLLTDIVEAYEGSARVFARAWSKAVPRDLV